MEPVQHYRENGTHAECRDRKKCREIFFGHLVVEVKRRTLQNTPYHNEKSQIDKNGSSLNFFIKKASCFGKGLFQ